MSISPSRLSLSFSHTVHMYRNILLRIYRRSFQCEMQLWIALSLLSLVSGMTQPQCTRLLTSHNSCEKVPTITSTVANRDPPTVRPRADWAELSSPPSTIASPTSAAVPIPWPSPPVASEEPLLKYELQGLPLFRELPSIRVRRCSSDRRCPSDLASSEPLHRSVEQQCDFCEERSAELPPVPLLPWLSSAWRLSS